ncbi:MAG: flagellar hook-length control protein FliK [Bryobacterales bacterium]|nr:flagellar hook-length control protein FliK [Bryobacterales bacterium]
MKVSHTQKGSPTQSGSTDAASRADRKDTGGKESRFGNALDKKAAEKEAPERATQGDPLADARMGVLPAFAQTLHPTTQASAGPVSASATTTPPEITALQHEISHSLEVTGPNEVRIQFDSKTFDGLSVTLTREGGALQVSMQASSPEIARFLEAHAASLAQRLEQPERAAYIRIETTNPGSRDSGGNAQGDRQRDRDDDRDRQSAANNPEGATS